MTTATAARTAARSAGSRTGPTPPGERITSLDIIRGFAIFGILLVNVNTYLARPEGGWDLLARRLITVVADGKFYPLFSLLFGIGLALQMERARARGQRYAGRYLARLVGLFLIGAAHMTFIWSGDILLDYAYAGTILLAVSFIPSRKMVLVAAVLCFTATFTGESLSGILLPERPATEALEGASRSGEEVEEARRLKARRAGLERRARAQALQRALRDGDYPVMVRHRARLVSGMAGGGLYPSWVLLYASFFLVGLYAGRRGVLRDPEAHRTFLRRVFWVGLLVGLPAGVARAFGLGWARVQLPFLEQPLLSVWAPVGGPLLGFAYGAGLLLLLQRSRWQERLAPLAPVGRMALTNYLMQSLILTTIFYGYGFAILRVPGRELGLVLTVTILAFQVLFSVWWLRRFRFGPVEWLWRSMTYARIQPLRLRGPGKDG